MVNSREKFIWKFYFQEHCPLRQRSILAKVFVSASTIFGNLNLISRKNIQRSFSHDEHNYFQNLMPIHWNLLYESYCPSNHWIIQHCHLNYYMERTVCDFKNNVWRQTWTTREIVLTTQIECTLQEEQNVRGHEMGSTTQIQCTLREEQNVQGHEMGLTTQIERTLRQEQIMWFHCKLFFEQHSIQMKDEQGRRSMTSIQGGDTMPSNGRPL